MFTTVTLHMHVLLNRLWHFQDYCIAIWLRPAKQPHLLHPCSKLLILNSGSHLITSYLYNPPVHHLHTVCIVCVYCFTSWVPWLFQWFKKFNAEVLPAVLHSIPPRRWSRSITMAEKVIRRFTACLLRLLTRLMESCVIVSYFGRGRLLATF